MKKFHNAMRRVRTKKRSAVLKDQDEHAKKLIEAATKVERLYRGRFRKLQKDFKKRLRAGKEAAKKEVIKKFKESA